jgi:hypothetical protein
MLAALFGPSGSRRPKAAARISAAIAREHNWTDRRYEHGQGEGMRLNGWNYIPDGYGMAVDAAAAPVWLRIWFRVPFLDRFSYPIMVKRGLAWLTRDEHEATRPNDAPPGWRVRSEDESWVQLRRATRRRVFGRRWRRA